MKKKIIALLTSLLCMTTPLSANAVDLDVDMDVAFTYMTDTFTYKTNNRYGSHSGFYLESELVDPDFMVVGYVYYEDNSDSYSYLVSPINNDRLLKSGMGFMMTSTVVQELGDQKLRVGDLLKIDGEILAAETEPVIYSPREEGTMSFIGNGVDIFGEEFERVIRLQLVIDQEAYENAHARIYDIDLLRGDVNVDDSINVLDCISINKNLLAGAPLCDYAKIAGDINENSMIDADDSLAILKEIVGLTENFE